MAYAFEKDVDQHVEEHGASQSRTGCTGPEHDLVDGLPVSLAVHYSRILPGTLTNFSTSTFARMLTNRLMTSSTSASSVRAARCSSLVASLNSLAMMLAIV